MNVRSSLRIGAVLVALGSLPNFVHAATGSRVSVFGYGADGILRKEVVEPASSSECVVKIYGYDSYGNRSTETIRNCNGETISQGLNDPAGASYEAAAPTGTSIFATRTNSVQFDAQGFRPIARTNALGQTDSNSYSSSFGLMTSVTNANGLVTTWTYDSFGRKERENRPDGTYTKWLYQYCSGLTTVPYSPTDSADCGNSAATYVVTEQVFRGSNVVVSAPVKRFYDLSNREVSNETLDLTGAKTVVVTTEYDSLGRVARISDPTFYGDTPRWTSYTYDELDRVRNITSPDGNSSRSYNALATTTTDSLNHSITQVVDSQGNVKRITDAGGYVTQFEYDAFGNPVKTVDPNGGISTAVFSVRGLRKQFTEAHLGTWNYSRDALGQIIQQIDQKGQITSFVYDKLGRVTARNQSDLQAAWYFDKYADGSTCSKGVGKLCEATASNGYSRKTSFDAFGRAITTTTTIDSPYTVSVTYNPDSTIATQTYPNGFGVKYVYSSATGRLLEVRDKTSDVRYWAVQETDAESNITREIYGNNVTTTSVFEPATGRLSNIYAGTGNSVLNLGYGYDSKGNLKNRSDGVLGVSESFLYDNLDRLETATVNSSGVGVSTVTTKFDALGNITSRTGVGNYSYLTAVGGRSMPSAVSTVHKPNGNRVRYTYDAQGNLTNESEITAGGMAVPSGDKKFTYTSFNKISGIEAYSLNPAPIAHFTYECRGRDCTFNASSSFGVGTFQWVGTNTLTGATWTTGSGSTHQATTPSLFNNFKMTLTMTDGIGRQSVASVQLDLAAGGLLCNINWGSHCVATTGNTGATPSGPPKSWGHIYYGPEQQRVRQSIEAVETVYVNFDNEGTLLYEKNANTQRAEHRYYVYAGEKLVSIITQTQGSTLTPLYVHSDRQDSIVAITNGSGAVIERFSYDPFGKKRATNGAPADVISVNTDRGYTSHEHIDVFGLVNMNGRFYDPEVARFMSADPFVSDVGGQALNRYSYVANNPFAFTDPSGYSWWGKQVNRFGNETKRWERDFRREIRRPNSLLGPSLRIVGAGASVLLCGPYAPGCVAAVEASISRSQGITGEDLLKNAAIAGATQYAFSGAGDLVGTERLVAHATIGCVSAYASGANCGRGAAAAFLGVVTSDAFGDIPIVSGVAAAAVGGASAELLGGNFVNGAMTASFGYLYNSVEHLILGMDAHTVLFMYENEVSPTPFVFDVGWEGLGRYRPDFRTLEKIARLLELKPLASEAKGARQLLEYVKLKSANGPAQVAIGNANELIFHSFPQFTLPSNRFYNVSYTYRPSATFKGVITYTIDRPGVLSRLFGPVPKKSEWRTPYAPPGPAPAPSIIP